MELENLANKNLNRNIEKEINTEVTEKSQKSFLNTTLGKVINTGIDLGLRAIFPSLIEDQVINIKNSLLKGGLKKGISVAIDSAIDLGKSAIGIATGKFENLSQVQTAIKKGGIIDNVSEAINNVLKNATNNNLLNKGTANFIKRGKNAILKTVESNIEDKFMGQVNSLEKVSKYITNWKNYYIAKDMEGMTKEYNKIKEEITGIVPLEETIKEVKRVENMHKLLKAKGVDYKLSEQEIELIEKLT